MKLGILAHEKFKSTLNSINSASAVSSALKLRKLKKAVKEQQDLHEGVRQDLLKKYGKLKEDGTLETEQKGDIVNAVFEDDSKKVAFFQDLRELDNTEVTVPMINVSDLTSNITELDLAILEGVLTDFV